jgi:hypothetical protein
MLEVLPATDGVGPIGPAPVPVHPDDVDALLETLCDESRRGPVFVAGPAPSEDHAGWIETVSTLTRDVVGLCPVYILSPDARAPFADGISYPFAVGSGALRTYLPGVDPALEAQARLHRVLSAQTIAKDGAGAWAKRLGVRVRDVVTAQPIPPHVARASYVLDRLAAESVLVGTPARDMSVTPDRAPADASNMTVVEEREPDVIELSDDALATTIDLEVAATGAVDATTTEALAAPPSIIDRVSRMVRQLFGRKLDDDSLDQLERHATAGVLAEVEAAELIRAKDLEKQEADRLRLALEDEKLDHWETSERLLQLDTRLRALESRLYAEGRHEEVADSYLAETDDRPESLPAVLDRLGTPGQSLEDDDRLLHFVVFTGDREPVLDLDEQDPLGQWAGKVWDALLVLEDYGRVKSLEEFHGGVHLFCQRPPAGCHGWSANRHAPGESDSVSNRSNLRAYRTLPVPDTVDPTGKVYMEAHFKIAQSTSVSPRMHYHDDTARTGLIYVGYIGRHLPTGEGA